MTEVKENWKVRKINWPLITDRSSQQQANEGEKSPPTPGGEPMLNSNSNSNCHSRSPPRPHQIIFILLFLAIILSIATMLSDVFNLESCEFDDFNNDFNVLNNDFELEKSGLNNNEYDLCDVLPSPVFDTIGAAAYTPPAVFEFIETRTVLFEFGDLEYDFNAVLSATTTVTTVPNENEIRMKNKSGPHGPHTYPQTQQQHATAPVIDSDDNFCPTGIGLILMNMYLVWY